MERYFKISETELLELLARDISYRHMECAGVDNWDDGGEVPRMFKEDCIAANLPEPEGGYWYGYTYTDLARVELKNYQEVK